MVLTGAEIAEITERHRKVDADPRFTDKLAHRDRGRLLDHIAAAQQARPPLTASVHDYRPHKTYPQFCDACGYGPGETLMHIQG